MYDIAVIGAGVIGTAVARELSRYNLNIVMLERDNDVACGTTKANSAIVHAGYDASADSMKGIMNAKGNAMFGDVCKDLDVPFERIGSLVVAFSEEDMVTLQGLLENGQALGIPGLEIIDSKTVYEKEPNLNPGVRGALYAPSAGITEPWELAIAYAENAIENGAELKLNFEVKSIEKQENGFEIKSENETIQTRLVINCAGVYADKIHNMVADAPEFKIHPRRGQYFLLDKTTEGFVDHVIFPCPSKMGKGTLVVPTVDGNILIGPDSQDLGMDDKEATETTGDRLAYVREMVSQLTTKVPFREQITEFSGLRAEPDGGDFIIDWSKSVSGFYNVAGIKSPGLSSAPAIAERVLEAVVETLSPEEKTDFNPVRRPRVKLEDLNDDELQALIEKDPRYGRIICRCEMISEGEIVDAIHRAAGGRTINGIKRRVRPGAGRCQGGFCGPRVLEILARELDLNPTEIAHEGKDSYVLIGETKA
ncbi:NAD(P)/FAD-dependent oxidoreductase [Fusibacter sp. JL216-2]|uniref:NAD(P)/FAD-dependent oxidoreductase n=1 Tax=Fusibacter sp. JL216-2 TaxID=3071453 RepID=UPI003D353CD9